MGWRGRAAVLAVLVGAAAIAFVVWPRGGEAPAVEPTRTPRAVAPPVPRTVEATAGVPPWLLEERYPRRRVAGRVIFAGAPVAGATVRLERSWNRLLGMPGLVRTTGSDGRFDFGPQPAHPGGVVASAPGKTAAVLWLELEDPGLTPPPDQLELELTPCDTVAHGHVRDASGGVIVGARVTAGWPGAVVESDDQGRWELCVKKGFGALTVEADGYGGASLHAELEGRHDVILVPETSIVGRCVDEQGGPVPDAVVVATAIASGARVGAASGSALSDAEGRFRITGLTPARYLAKATSADRRARPVMLLAVGGKVADDEVTIEMLATSRVRGKLLRAGVPVARANLHLSSRDVRSDHAWTREDGSFEVEGVPQGVATLEVQGHTVLAPSTLDVTLPVHEGVIVELASLSSIRGRVLRDGKPVGDIPVFCARDGLHRAERSSSEGRFVCKDVGPGSYSVNARDQGGGARGHVQVTVAAEDVLLDIELDVRASIAGRVVDQHGKPVPRVEVTFRRDGPFDVRRDETDETGHFRVDALEGGGIYNASVDGYDAARPFPRVELSGKGTIVEGVTLEVRDDALAIRGKVLDDTGAPALDARVGFARVQPGREAIFALYDSAPGAVTDLDGAFSIGGLTRGDYALRARGADGVETEIRVVPAGTNDVILRLPKGGTIEGKLLGFTHPPRVEIMRGDAPMPILASVQGDRFRITSLPPGQHIVTASGDGEGSESRSVELAAGQTVTVTLTAHGFATVSGRVVELRSGAPVSGLTCAIGLRTGVLRGGREPDMTSVDTAADGTFRLEKVPAGDVYLACGSGQAGLSGASRLLTLARGEHATVEAHVYRCALQGTGKEHSRIGLVFDWRALVPRVGSVLPGGPAERAGILPADVISFVDTVPTEGLSVDAVSQLVMDRAPGSEVTLTLLRGARVVQVKVTTEARPQN